MHISEDLVPDFALAIGSTDERVAVEDRFHVCEIDFVVSQIIFLMPSEPGYAREQRLDVFVHQCSRQPPASLSEAQSVRRTGRVVYTSVYIRRQSGRQSNASIACG
jgi:hypothetical protein